MKLRIRIQEYAFNRKNLPRRTDFLKQQQTKTSKQMNYYLRMITSPLAKSASGEVILFRSIKDFNFIPYS